VSRVKWVACTCLFEAVDKEAVNEKVEIPFDEISEVLDLVL